MQAKIKKGFHGWQRTPIEEWGADDFIGYFLYRFKLIFKVESRSTFGKIRCHINHQSVVRMQRLEGKNIDVHPNQLYREFIDRMIAKSTLANFKLSVLSNAEAMASFLEVRAQNRLNAEIGTAEDFQAQEEARIRKAQEYFKTNQGEADVK